MPVTTGGAGRDGTGREGLQQRGACWMSDLRRPRVMHIKVSARWQRPLTWAARRYARDSAEPFRSARRRPYIGRLLASIVLRRPTARWVATQRRHAKPDSTICDASRRDLFANNTEINQRRRASLRRRWRAESRGKQVINSWSWWPVTRSTDRWRWCRKEPLPPSEIRIAPRWWPRKQYRKRSLDAFNRPVVIY